jgi:hypothetical protein
MLRTCVLTVFTETESWLAISGLERFVGRYRSTLSSLEVSSSVGGAAAWSRARQRRTVQHIEDVRAVRRERYRAAADSQVALPTRSSRMAGRAAQAPAR